MITVACCYKYGDGFTPEYVDKLQENVEQHLNTDYEFVVVTPSRNLPPKAKGFWIKLELFKKDRFNGPIVYLDLDTIIVGEVTEIFTYPHKFTMGTDWQKHTGPNSTFMAWDGTQDLSHLDVPFDWQIMNRYTRGGRWGDQWFVFEKVGLPITWLDTLFPGALVSYKFTVSRVGLPSSAKIVAFHGSPRPHNIDWNLDGYEKNKRLVIS